MAVGIYLLLRFYQFPKMSIDGHLDRYDQVILQSMKKWILIVVFVTMSVFSKGQTCCTGGVPYFGSFKIPIVSAGQFGLDLSYVFNNNSDLILNNKEIKNEVFRRSVNTILFQANYGLTDKLSISINLPYLWQIERIELDSDPYELSNKGMGDISIWTSYRQSFKSSDIIVGAALKLPNGKTNATNSENGIALPLSFQNGSGSWDIIFLTYNEIHLNKSKTWNWINSFMAKVNSAGKGFDAHQGYRFGHSLQFVSLISANLVLGKSLAIFYLGASYQERFKDQFNGGYDNVNTGGEWVNLDFGFNHQLTPIFSMGFSGSFPLFRSINGLQLTTTNQFNLTFGYVL